MNIGEFLSSFRPGETVLFEYSPKAPPEILFFEIVRWAEEKGYPVLVDDVLDTLDEYLRRLSLMGA